MIGAAKPASAITTRHRRNVGGQLPIAIVVEQRPLMRDVLSQCLSGMAGFEVFTAASVGESVRIAEENDVAIILISVAGDTDSDETRQVLQRAAQVLVGTPIVVLSDGEQPHQVRNALLAGARGYVPTSMSLDDTIGALWFVQAGGQFLPATCIVGLGRSRGNSR